MLKQLRYLVPTAAVLAFAPLQPAEAQSIQPGLMAGASLSTFTGDFVEDAKKYASFIAGAFVRLEFMGFAVEPGAYYTRKGAKTEEEGEVAGTNSLSYLQIPLVIKLGIPFGRSARIYFGGGPAIGLNLGCSFTAAAGGGSASTDCEEGGGGLEAASTEMSGIAVAGIEFGKLSLGVRGDFGLTNVYEAVAGNSSVEPEIKTQTISAVLSIRF